MIRPTPAKIVGLLLSALCLLTACSQTGSDDELSCASSVTYKQAVYYDITNVDFTPTRKLGTVEFSSCDDGDDSLDERQKSFAFAVEELDPKIAIAVGQTPKTASLMVTKEGNRLPKEVAELIKSE